MKVLQQGFVLLAALSGPVSMACDLCSVYTATQARGESKEGFYGGMAEQFTSFGTLKSDGHTVANDLGQSMSSSISQFFVAYGLSDNFSIQLNLPVIYRSYNRPSDVGGVDKGSVTGPGDMSVLGKYALYEQVEENLTVNLQLIGGIKVPTGSTNRLGEELQESEAAESGTPSGIHGHDLTLGSGSVDGLIGTNVYSRWHRALFQATAQYAIRTQGSIGYRFANDFMWSGGPGYYLFLNHGFTANLVLNLSGEIKGLDSLQGKLAEDTGIKSLYLGPQVSATFGKQIAAVVGLDLPVITDNTSIQVVPDSRLRGSVTMQF